MKIELESLKGRGGGSSRKTEMPSWPPYSSLLMDTFSVGPKRSQNRGFLRKRRCHMPPPPPQYSEVCEVNNQYFSLAATNELVGLWYNIFAAMFISLQSRARVAMNSGKCKLLREKQKSNLCTVCSQACIYILIR